jgi:hypothetical protein
MPEFKYTAERARPRARFVEGGVSRRVSGEQTDHVMIRGEPRRPRGRRGRKRRS